MTNALQRLIEQTKALPIWNQLQNSDNLDDIGAGVGAVAGAAGGGLLGMIIAGKKKRMKGFGWGSTIGGGVGAAAGYGLGDKYMGDRDFDRDLLAGEQTIRDEEATAENRRTQDDAFRDEEEQVNEQFTAQEAKKKKTSDAYAGYESQMKAEQADFEKQAAETRRAGMQAQLRDLQAKPKASTMGLLPSNLMNSPQDRIDLETEPGSAAPTKRLLRQMKLDREMAGQPKGSASGHVLPALGDRYKRYWDQVQAPEGSFADKIKNAALFRGLVGGEVPADEDTTTLAPSGDEIKHARFKRKLNQRQRGK